MVDIILADAKLTPRGSVSDVTLDWASGTDENDFEMTIADPTPAPVRGWWWWIDDTEIGGRIDDMRTTVTSGASEVTWLGRTWTGLLASKIIRPDSGQDYLTVSGRLPNVVKSLVRRIGLDSVLTVDSDDKSTVTNWVFKDPRYVDAYTGLRNLLASCGRRLDINARNNRILLGITPVETIGNTVDSNLVDFKAETKHRTVNHLIGLGEQDLKNRYVSEWYADSRGNVSRKQTFTGVEEVAEIYDYSAAEQKTLDDSTMKRLQELQTGGTVDVTLAESIGERLKVDDIVTASDHNTGLTVTAKVTKRIIKISDGIMTASCEVGQSVVKEAISGR